MKNFILSLTLLSLCGCGMVQGYDQAPTGYMELTSSTCGFPKTTLRILGERPFHQGSRNKILIYQAEQQTVCAYKAEGILTYSGSTVTTEDLVVTPSLDCSGTPFVWEEDQSFTVSGTTVTLQTPSCTVTFN